MAAVRRAIALLVLVPLLVPAACGAPVRRPTEPAAGGGTTRRYEPLTIKPDAKAASLAVILGTDENNGSTVLTLPALPSKAQVDAMFVRLGPSGATGGVTPVRLSTAPNTDGQVQVGVYEELAGGTGSQWRAGVWVSAFVAASTLGKDLIDFSFSAASGGYIDGASASALMAAGFLATMTGEPIDPRATMTGILLPDGTIGPVAGIPEKFLGSLEKGKRKLGYPIGMRWARSETTGRMVDLVALARGHGAEAVELANIHDAYELLTGKHLPEPVPVPAEEMALDAATTQALEAKYRAWQQRVADEWAALLQLQQAGRLPGTLLALATHAQRAAEQAQRLHQQGLLAGAYAKMLQAWVYAASATSTHDVIAKLQAGDARGALAELATLDELDQRTAEVFREIGASAPQTLGDHLRMIAAFQAALRSWGFKVFARDSIASAKELIAQLATRSPVELRAPATGEAIVERVAPTVLLIGQTVVSAALAADELEILAAASVPYEGSIPDLQRIARSFQSAGTAGVNYFETLVVEPAASQLGVPLEQARVRIATTEPGYLVAYMLSRLDQVDGLPDELEQAWGAQSPQWSLLALAGSVLAYHTSAELIAKYHSLGLRLDPRTGRSRDVVSHPKAFANMLASAERNARASARAAKIATGSIPVPAKLAYQQATIVRAGDVSDQLQALSQYWMSSAYSQAAVMLARN